MKSRLYYLLALILITSCSSPKYTYNFDHYNYNAGKQGAVAEHAQPENKLMPVKAEDLLASTEKMLLPGELTNNASSTELDLENKKTYAQMSRTERKAFRSEVKKFLKEKKESIKAAKKTNAMDHDLRLAAIFAAVGLVALIINGSFFYIVGGIALIIGVIFFVKWLVRQ